MAKPRKSEIDAVKQAVDALSIMFDNVIVLVNRYDPTTEKTIAFSAVQGNRMAAVGHASAWLNDMEDGADAECDCGECDRGSCDCEGCDRDAADDDEDGPDIEPIGPDDEDEKFNR